MSQHRAVRRLGIVLALPVALLLVPLMIVVASPRAAAVGSITVTGSGTCISGYRWQVTWTIITDTPPSGSTGTWTIDAYAPIGASPSATSGSAGGTDLVTQLLAQGDSAYATLTAHVDYGDGNPTPVGPVQATFSGTCVVPTTPPPTSNKPPTSRPPTTRPPTTSSSAVVVPTVVATTASPTASDVLIVGTDTETSQQQAAGGDGGGSRPSFILLIATLLILLGFLIALIFLIRERRALKRDRDDEDDEYWDGYRTGYR